MTASNEQIERLAQLERAVDELRHGIDDLRSAVGIPREVPPVMVIPDPTPPPGMAVLPTSSFDVWWTQSQAEQEAVPKPPPVKWIDAPEARDLSPEDAAKEA